MMLPAAGKPPRPVVLLRLQRGMTQRAVAASAGLTVNALYHIERGRRWPTPPSIVKLAAALDVQVEFLVAAVFRGWLTEHGLAQPEGGHP